MIFMKKKSLSVIVIIALLLALSAVYLGIVVANNSIANRVEKELKAHPLPEDTLLFDSVSIAGKLVGNGNGMQYMGSILVVSDLSEEELYEYYSQSFEYIEVRKQESQKIDFLNTSSYSFELFADPEHYNQYSVTCWGAPKTGKWIRALLDMDLRGH